MNSNSALLPVYSAIGSSILTAIVTLLSVYLANKSNTTRIKIEMELNNKSKLHFYKKEKLEALYINFDKWSKFVLMNWIDITSVMDGKLTLNQVNEMVLKNKGNSEIDHSKIEMTIRLYFPELKEHYNKASQTKSAANKYMLQFRNEYLNGNTDGKKYIQDFLSAQAAFAESTNKFKEEIEKLEINKNA